MKNNLILQKKEISNKLFSLKTNLEQIEKNFGIDLLELKSKANIAIDNIEKDVFSIAFFGVFSDGKSTVISVLTDNLDIKISPEPTTDEIKPYPYKNFQIIDTPGLHSGKLAHDELTKKYISESNIVIFTVDPVNPLKDSHKLEVKWILKDLKKFDSTIIVINKMDEVADLEDEIDFNMNSKIKKEVVSETIKEITGIDKEIRIVCIAADPFEKGLLYWKKNETEYRKLSRIDLLENMISEFQSNYKDELIVRGGISVIRDLTSQVISNLEEIRNSFVNQREILKHQIDEYNEKVKILESDINRSYRNIKEDFIQLREDILIELDSVSNMSDLADVILKRLGDQGYILQEKIDLLIEKHTGNLLTSSKDLFESIEESLIYHSEFQKELGATLSQTGKSVLNVLQISSVKTISKAIIKTRDFLKIPFKFKPWGAINLAKFLKFMPAIAEILQFGASLWAKSKLDKKRNELKSEIESSFKNLIKDFDKDKYVKNYFPFISESIKILDLLKQNINEITESIEKIDNIKKQLVSITL